jgi:carbon-monoxide dehydrogenase medium subunit
VKPSVFEHHPVDSVEEAVDLLGELGDDAKVLAGGQSLMPLLALRLARFDHLIDVNPMVGPEGSGPLAGVRAGDCTLTIGAGTRHRTVEADARVNADVPLLARATAHVGHFQIRNRGTIGGAIAHADPAAEQPAVALALDAVMIATSRRGQRRIRAADFFVSTWTTSLEPDEILTAIEFPVRAPRSGFAVEELARRRGDFAMAGVACSVTVDEGGAIASCRLAMFGVAPTPVRLRDAEDALVAGSDTAEAAALAAREIRPPADLHASAEYRKQVAPVLVERALAMALLEAHHA